MPRKDVGVDKVLKKLQASVDEGKFYEASQMYHSLSQRYLKSGKEDIAKDLLYRGILSFLAAGHADSAFDLSTKMMEVYLASETNPEDDESARSRLLEIFRAFPGTTDKATWRLDYARSVRRWAAKALGNNCGHPGLNHDFGSAFYQEGEYYAAESFLLFGTLESARVLGRMASEWSIKESDAPDPGYFIARETLGLLALKKLQHAKSCVETYIKLASQAAEKDAQGKSTFTGMIVPYYDAITNDSTQFQLYKSALLNFSVFLNMACERGVPAKESFSMLRNHYKNALISVDDYLPALVDSVGENFFGLHSNKPKNPLADLMKGMF